MMPSAAQLESVSEHVGLQEMSFLKQMLLEMAIEVTWFNQCD